MRRFLYGLPPLLLGAVFFTVPVSQLRAQSEGDQADIRVLEYLAAHRTDGQTAFWRGVSNANNYVDVAIPVGLLTAGIIRNDERMRQNALYIASSTAFTALANYVIKKLVKRPRPFVTHIHFTPVYRPGEYSFPSGHTSSSFSTAIALSRAYPRWYVIAPSVLWAGATGYSRMYLGVHYPSDVAAGILLGGSSTVIMGFIRP